jgi:hypothetical protein
MSLLLMKTPFFSRFWPASVIPLFVIAAIAAGPMRAEGDVSKDDSAGLSAIALHWLADWDARNWAACWNAFSPDVKGNIRLDRWSLAEGYFKDHLGDLKSRKFAKVDSTLIPGDIVIVEFDSLFEHKGPRSEGIYLEKEPNGSWGVYALVNKPVTAEWPRQFGDVTAGSPPLDIHWAPGPRP